MLQGDKTLPTSLEGKLMAERETLYSQLVDVKYKMVGSKSVSLLPSLTSHCVSCLCVVWCCE